MSHRQSVYDVFTPTTQARLNFVERTAVNDQVVDAVRTPGKQVVIYGETGSGKSTLLQRKLEQLYTDHITTRCSASSTFASVLLDGFDQLDRHYVESTRTSKSSKLKGTLGLEFLKVKAAIESELSKAKDTQSKRIISPQLTAQRLGEFMGAAEICWVLEDFHKLPPEEKVPLSQALKIFCDLGSQYPRVKIVAIGATDTAREVVQYDREMANRVAEIHIPLMNRTELSSIIGNGSQLMNVEFTSIGHDIVGVSAGLASVCHHIALNTCIAAGIESTAPEPVHLSNDHLEAAIRTFMDESSDSLKALFDAALAQQGARKYDNPRLILASLAATKLDGLRFGEILRNIRKEEPNYPRANLSNYLKQLTSGRRGWILRLSASGRYRYAEPILHSYAQVLLGQRAGGGGVSDRVFFLVYERLRSIATKRHYVWPFVLADSGKITLEPRIEG